jgi:hypothetical protein
VTIYRPIKTPTIFKTIKPVTQELLLIADKLQEYKTILQYLCNRQKKICERKDF